MWKEEEIAYFDDKVSIAFAQDFMERQVKADKPFFVWVSFTHMHLWTETKKESVGQSGKVAVGVSRFDDRSRQERR